MLKLRHRSWRAVRRFCAIAVLAGIAATSTGCGDHEADAEPVDTTIEAAPSSTEAVTSASEPATDAINNALAAESPTVIDSCYHLDSCGAWKVLAKSTAAERGLSRLIEATLQWGEIPSPESGQIAWRAEQTKVHAVCSTKSPLLLWREGNRFVAEEFDFAGEGVPGVQVNNATLYEALCHPGADGAIQDPEKAASAGYRPLIDGGRGQFEVGSIHEILNSDW